jgi:hypothetical protein
VGISLPEQKRSGRGCVAYLSQGARGGGSSASSRAERNAPGNTIPTCTRQHPIHALWASEPKPSARTAPSQKRLNHRLRGRAFLRIGSHLRLIAR